jgi:hypothetical protein
LHDGDVCAEVDAVLGEKFSGRFKLGRYNQQICGFQQSYICSKQRLFMDFESRLGNSAYRQERKTKLQTPKKSGHPLTKIPLELLHGCPVIANYTGCSATWRACTSAGKQRVCQKIHSRGGAAKHQALRPKTVRIFSSALILLQDKRTIQLELFSKIVL